METVALQSLAQVVLPQSVLVHFEIAKVESDESTITIHLDEKMNKELQSDVHFISKGFITPVTITDFPIRDHKVFLILRRRRWLDIRTNKSFILPMTDLAAEGARYSKEFASFLKETYGDIPSDLPYA